MTTSAVQNLKSLRGIVRRARGTMGSRLGAPGDGDIPGPGSLPPGPGPSGLGAGPQRLIPEAWDLANCVYIVQSGDDPVSLAAFAKILNYQGGKSPIHGINMYNGPAGITDSKGYTDPKKWYPGARINMPPEACSYVGSLPCPAGYQKGDDGVSCVKIPTGGGGDIIPASVKAWTTGEKIAAGAAATVVVVGGGWALWRYVISPPKRKNPRRRGR